MRIININTSYGIEKILFPDNQPHINLSPIISRDERVCVICSITDSLTLLQLLECVDSIDHMKGRKRMLIIPYLMGARYDRYMGPNDSFDLRVISRLINDLDFEDVWLFDPHSDVSLALINRSSPFNNKELVQTYSIPNSVLICPDAGASKKMTSYMNWNENLIDLVLCNKKRDSKGKIELHVMDPNGCRGRDCVIIDDICDGGGTFMAIEDQIDPKSLTLIVTHGVFSKGTKIFEKRFDKIIVSDSMQRSYDSPIVTTIKMDWPKIINYLI